MSKNILVFAEVRNGEIKKAALEAIGAASNIVDEVGGQVSAVMVGSDLSNLADLLANSGAGKVFLADNPVLSAYSPDAYAKVIADTVADNDMNLVMVPFTAMGKDLGPRIAAKLDVGMVSDCTGIRVTDGEVNFQHPIYAGKAISWFRQNGDGCLILGTRPNVFSVMEETGKTAEIVNLDIDIAEESVLAKVVDLIKPEHEELDVTEASVVVSGGRGMKGPENFAMLEELAEIFNGAVGASRAAVDAGWIPQSHQVGQTGKVVIPDLYLACGISGAIQHQAGMRSSKYIVAINKDPDAPIFKLADFGIVGDLFEVIPKFKEELEKLSE